MSFITGIVLSISGSAIFTSSPVQAFIMTLGLSGATVGAQILALGVLATSGLAIGVIVGLFIYRYKRQAQDLESTLESNLKRVSKKTRSRSKPTPKPKLKSEPESDLERVPEPTKKVSEPKPQAQVAEPSWGLQGLGMERNAQGKVILDGTNEGAWNLDRNLVQRTGDFQIARQGVMSAVGNISDWQSCFTQMCTVADELRGPSVARTCYAAYDEMISQIVEHIDWNCLDEPTSTALDKTLSKALVCMVERVDCGAAHADKRALIVMQKILEKLDKLPTKKFSVCTDALERTPMISGDDADEKIAQLLAIFTQYNMMQKSELSSTCSAADTQPVVKPSLKKRRTRK